MTVERVQKILSRCGFGSRRECEKIISSGRVEINYQTAKLGDRADYEHDMIYVDKKPIKKRVQPNFYIAFYKPKFVLSEVKKNDKRKTIADFIDIDAYFYIVGRLDYDSEGLILVTNDGELTNRLTHPRYEHEKEYHVLIAKSPDEKQIDTWRRGVVLENRYQTLPAHVDFIKNEKNGTWLRIILKEGKKRQIRETGKTIGLPVKKIIRKRIGSIRLHNLQPGQWRYLNKKEVDSLLLLTKN